jgi:hypothetical protein
VSALSPSSPGLFHHEFKPRQRPATSWLEKEDKEELSPRGTKNRVRFKPLNNSAGLLFNSHQLQVVEEG